jgi:tripartite-type tricarboxylate transporter receptor subunit TctC
MHRRTFLFFGAASVSAAAFAPSDALAQARFPERPIKLVVPFSAGGVNDIVGRQWAEKMRAPLGAVYVENQGGAGGTLGAAEVARAAPDGHSLFLGSTSTMLLNAMTMSRLPYDPAKDFEPIAILCVSATTIAVHPSVPAKNLKELIAHIKANPAKLSYGSAGTGTMSHLSGELFKRLAGVPDIVHIPYKGAGPGLTDLVSGHIPMMSPNVTGQVLELHKTGKIRILAINAEARISAAPDIPTAIEEGVPNMIGQLFLGIFAPSGTPKAIVERIAEATRTAMADPDYQKALAASGFESVANSGPEQARRYMAEEQARWAPVVKAIDLKVQ